MELSEITGIGRRLDPRHPTNLVIVLLSMVVTLVIAGLSIYQGLDLYSTFIKAARVGITFFVGWAIAREFDPDNPYSGFLAAFAVLIAYLGGYSGDLLFLGLMVLLLRYVNRSTGVAATVVDLTVGLLLAAWLTWNFDWIVGLIAGVGYAIDGLLSEDKSVRYAYAGIMLIAAAVSAFWGPSITQFNGLNAQVVTLSISFIIISLPLYFAYRTTKSVGDFTDEPLSPRRIQFTQILYIGTTIGIGLKLGIQNTGVMLTSGSIIIATAIYHVISALFPHLRTQKS